MRTVSTTGRRLSKALLTPALAWTLAFCVLPCAAILALSLTAPDGSDITLLNYRLLLDRTDTLPMLADSLFVALAVAGVSVLLAFPFAWFVAEKVPARLQALALLVAVLPAAAPGLARAYGWSLALSPNGTVNAILLGSGLVAEPLSFAGTRLAMIAGMVHFTVTISTLAIYLSLRCIAPGLHRAATDLGAGRLSIFVRITLPLARRGILAAAGFSFLFAFYDVAFPVLLGAGARPMLAQEVMTALSAAGGLPSAAVMTVVLMVVGFAFGVAALRVTKRG